MNTPNLAGPAPRPLPRTMLVSITPAVLRDYEARGVFPLLRVERGEALPNGHFRFELSRTAAEAMLDDAEARWRDAPRPQRTAFVALCRKLRIAFRWRFDNYSAPCLPSPAELAGPGGLASAIVLAGLFLRHGIKAVQQ